MWRERKQKSEDFDNKITATRARGIIFLISALFLFQVCLLFYNRCIRGREIVSSDTNTKTKTNTSITNSSNSLNSIHLNKERKESLFVFNPNTISLDSLCLLGLSKKQAQIIINYRSKGGKFRKKEDFAKMYSVSESFYDRVEPYIVLNQEQKNNYKDQKIATNNKSDAIKTDTIKSDAIKSDAIRADVTKASATETSATKTSVTKTSVTKTSATKASAIKSDEFKTSDIVNSSKKNRVKSIINLNTADSLQLVSLYGIGPYYAKKILEYRDRIGSYAYVEQLLEIRGIDSARLENIINYIQIPEGSIKKFSLDTISVDFMKRNPYIGAYAAQGIILLRNQSNADTLHITPQLLLKEKILNQKQVRKLMMYCE